MARIVHEPSPASAGSFRIHSALLHFPIFTTRSSAALPQLSSTDTQTAVPSGIGVTPDGVLRRRTALKCTSSPGLYTPRSVKTLPRSIGEDSDSEKGVSNIHG